MAWVCLTCSCCAATAPTPSNSAPATITVRIISPIPFVVDGPVNPRPSCCAVSVPTPLPALHSRSRQISQTMPALMLADRDPDPFSGSGHVDVVDLVLTPQPVDDGVHHRRTGADRAGLARALNAQRLGLGGT